MTEHNEAWKETNIREQNTITCPDVALSPMTEILQPSINEILSLI